MKVVVKRANQLRNGDRYLNREGEIEVVKGNVDHLGNYVTFDKHIFGDDRVSVATYMMLTPVEVLV